MTVPPQRIVIVGAGQAGAQAAISLRSQGFGGRIVLIGAESAPPYQRPPLSKAYLKGEMEADRLYLKPHDFYAEAGIELVTGAVADRIDLADRKLWLHDGRSFDWDRLVLATGTRPRRLDIPGAELGNIFVLRTLADVEAMRPLFRSGARLVVIGAGYIGLEASAVARQLGLEVIVLEAAPQVLGRVAGPEIGAFYADLHRKAGTDIRTDARLAGFEGVSTVTAVRMANGSTLACDLVLVGVGVLPNLEIARDAGLVCENGIVVDAQGRTSHPDVFAAGDVALRPLVHYGRSGRLESVHNAIEGGKIVAATILGLPAPTLEAPWFWSDQFDIKLQTAGLWTGADARVIRGDVEAHKFAVFYLKEGRVIAVDAVNAAPEFLVGKRLVAAATAIAPDELRDTSISMKEIGARALDRLS